MIEENPDSSLVVQRATRMDRWREEQHMADNYDRYDNEGGGGFMMGLLTGTVLGAGLGMLLAPKAGADLRGAIGEQARNWGSAASEQYRNVREQAGPLMDRGRDMVNQARDAVSRGVDEARGYAGATTGSSYAGSNAGGSFAGQSGSGFNTGTTGTTGSTGTGGSTTGSTGSGYGNTGTGDFNRG
jgi:gas vesicle protein